jgi:tape measure domain-containing protein
MSFQLAAAYVQLSNRGFSTVMGGVDAIRGKLSGLVSFATGPVAAGMAALGAGASVAGMVGLAAKVEQTTAQFKTLLGSVDAAKGMIEDLQKFSASTPFQFDGLADSAKVLLAFGVSSEQVVPTLKTLGDVAAATGNDVGELANIYGKVKAQGTLMTDSLNQFNERGIPIGARLAEMFQKTEAEIRDMASKGQISFGDLQKAMVGMTSEGGMAFNGMAEQSTTLGGLFSTMKDNISLLMGDIGAAIVEGFDLKGATDGLTQFVQRVRSEWLPSIVSGFQWMNQNIITPFFSAIGSMTNLVMEFVADIDLYWQYAYTSVGNSINNMWQHVSTFFQNAVTLGSWFVSSMLTYWTNLYNNAGRIFFNMIEMMKNIWSGLWNFIRGRGFDIDFSPMVDSFNAATEGIKMPELAAPQLDALSGDLDRIAGQLAARQDARRRRAEDAANAANDNSIAALEIQEGTEKGITEEKQKQKELSTSFVSLAGLANKMQESRKFTGGAAGGGAQAMQQVRPAGEMANNLASRQQINAMQQQVTTMTALLELARGAGIKIATQAGGVSLPAPSVQFGATPS